MTTRGLTEAEKERREYLLAWLKLHAHVPPSVVRDIAMDVLSTKDRQLIAQELYGSSIVPPLPPLPKHLPYLRADWDIYDEIKHVVDADGRVLKAAVVGSYARHLLRVPILRDFPFLRAGEWHVWGADSDVDVFIYMGAIVGSFPEWFKEKLNIEPLDIDPGDLEPTVSTTFAIEVSEGLSAILPVSKGHVVHFAPSVELSSYYKIAIDDDFGDMILLKDHPVKWSSKYNDLELSEEFLLREQIEKLRAGKYYTRGKLW